MSEINSNYIYGNSATKRGTSITAPGKDMDKNSFLRILAAELANQDPTNAADSTQYVTQMAQFVSMEQMTNLNNTMSFFANNSLVGKGVTLKTYDANGNQYTGIVKAVTRIGSENYISVLINEGGTNTYKDFKESDIETILDVPNYNLDSLTGNMSLLTSAALIGKNVEFQVKDGEDTTTYKGKVLEVFRDAGTIKLNVKLDDSETIKTFTLGELTKVS